MSRVLRFLVVLVLVAAACGGGGGDETTTVVAGGDVGSTTTTSTTTTSVSPSVDPGAGSSTDFCDFLREYAENSDLSPIGISAAEFEARFRANLAAIERAAQLAPSEIAGDVAMFATAFGGFVEFLDENDFNFLAMGEAALDDPRLKALEDPELTAAGDRIESFCGFNEGEFITNPQVGDPGGSGAFPPQSVPEGFPDALVPPGGQVVSAVELPGLGTVVTFDIESDVVDVIAYYTGVVGPPTAELPQPRGALWSGPFDGATVDVVVSETAPGMTQVNVTYG